MKNILGFFLTLLIYSSAFTADLQIKFDCDSKQKTPSGSVVPLINGDSLSITFVGKKESVKNYFFNSQVVRNDEPENVFEMIKNDVRKKLTTRDKYFSDSLKENDRSELTITITKIEYGSDKTFTLRFSADGKNFDTSRINIDEEIKGEADASAAKSFVVVDAEMISSISVLGSCQLCDLWSTPNPIKSKSDRKYSTDYIVVYDPSLSKDAYTICKHVFEKNDSSNAVFKFHERFIKIAPMWFAPHVGSQIRFEVVNQPLNKPFKLSVKDDGDLFNNGSSQFASIISGLVSANIVTPISGQATPPKTDSKASEHIGKEKETLPQVLDTVAAQILQYVIQFRVSSCAIQKHSANLAVMFTRINSIFGTAAFTGDQLATQLKEIIEREIKDDPLKAKAIQQADAIAAAFKAMENIQPLAYTTLRAKNRDFIEIKYIDANNVESKPENIRMSGGMKIDYSAGFVLTGLRDFSYSLKNMNKEYTPLDGPRDASGNIKIRDTTGNVIIKEDDGNNNVGVGILTHFYPRLSSHYNVGGTVGLMTSTNLNLRLMLGGSFMVSSLFGSNNRVSFSYGRVWGKVARLSTQHEDFFNKPRMLNGIPQFYSQAAAPQPIQRNEGSWFFAITMNFGGN